MKAVMYHYIRQFDKEYPEFKYLEVDKFIEQLDYFEKKWGFLSKEDFLESVETGRPKPGVILTFDDGLKEHHDVVLPILSERNLHGFFYIPTGHYQNPKKELLDVHRIHFLISKYDPDMLIAEVSEGIQSTMLDHDRVAEFEKDLYTNQSTDQASLKFKKLMNYYLKYEHKTAILGFLAKKYLTESEMYDKLYITIDGLKQLESEGNIVGAHTENHKVLSSLSADEQEEEISNSFSFLSRFLDMKVKSFCYPYGTRGTFNSDTTRILNKCGVHHSFMFTNSVCDDKIEKHQIERIDCNRF